MANLDNPAGRLHTILREYRTAAEDNVTIQQTWATVLGVEPADVPLALAWVGTLLPAIESAVNRIGDLDQVELFAHYSRYWAYPIATPDHATGQTPSPGKALIDPGALAALGGLSSFLSSVASEGTVPDDEHISSLRAQLLVVMEEAATASDIPPDLRGLLLDRLHDILWALDHLRVGGPDAARAAAERLLGEIVIRGDDSQRRPIVRRALQAAAAAWALFKTGTTIEHQLEAWGEIMKELPPG